MIFCTKKTEDIKKCWSELGFPSWVWDLVKDLDPEAVLDFVRMFQVEELNNAVSRQIGKSILETKAIEPPYNSAPTYWKEKLFIEMRRVLSSGGFIRGHHIEKDDNLRRFVLLRSFVSKLSSKKEYSFLDYTRRKDLERIMGKLYDYYRKNYLDYNESSLEAIFDCLTAYLPPRQKEMIEWYCSLELGCCPVLTAFEDELEQAVYCNMVLLGLPRLEVSIDDGGILID